MTASRRTKDPSRLPVRGAIGLGVTAGGLAMLMSLRPPAATGTELAFEAEPADGTSTLALAAATPAATAATSAAASPSASPAASATASASPAASASVSPSAAPSEETTTGQLTAVGDAVSFRFGVVQVQVTVENGVITDVTALQLPDEDNHSWRISQEVEPILQEEALAAQSADIDIISGATYTSRAYRQSLQSALDQLAA